MNEQDYEQLTLFPAGSHASHSPRPDSAEARRMTATSGLRCCELLRSCGPLGSLERMLLTSSIWRSTMCFLTWKAKATPRGRLWFQLAASALHTNDKTTTRRLFVTTQIAALGWVTMSYLIALYATVRLGQVFPVVDLSKQAIETILGVNVLKVVENIFEHNDGVVFGKSNAPEKKIKRDC